MPDDVNGDDEIWAGSVGQTWTFTLPAGQDIVMTDNFWYSSSDDYLKSGSALTIEMLYDTMYKMTGDPQYLREEKCKIVFEDVTNTLP